MTGVGLLVLVGCAFGATAVAVWAIRAATAGRDIADRALGWYDGADEVVAGE
jgi:hypothetical protein